jgi:FtsZ-binding cell division protein ZapB
MQNLVTFSLSHRPAMTSVTLIHPKQTFTTSVLQAVNKCSLFQKNATLLGSPYKIQSSVPLSTFRDFLSAFEWKAITITSTNFTGLQHLYEELGFSELDAQFSEFRPSMGFGNGKTRGRIAAIEEKVNQHDHDIAILQSEVRRISTNFERLVGEVSSLRSSAIPTLSEELTNLKTRIAQKQRQSDTVVETLLTDLQELRAEVSTLKPQIRTMSRNIADAGNQID